MAEGFNIHRRQFFRRMPPACLRPRPYAGAASVVSRWPMISTLNFLFGWLAREAPVALAGALRISFLYVLADLQAAHFPVIDNLTARNPYVAHNLKRMAARFGS